MITTDLFWIYLITLQITWVITFVVWEIKPLRPIREPFLLISFLITTPPVTLFMIISWSINKLFNKLKDKKRKPTPYTHEVTQDDETGLTLYSANDYNIGDLVHVDYERYWVLNILPPKNGVRGYRVKRVEEENEKETEKTR